MYIYLYYSNIFVDDAVLECTYESGANCFLSQAKDDDKDWVINQVYMNKYNTKHTKTD